MTTTDDRAVTITRFTREAAVTGAYLDTGYRACVVPWSEVRPGDRVLIEDSFALAEDVQVFLCDWGDGTQFVRVDVSTRGDWGGLGTGEHKGDLLTCVLRKRATYRVPLTEAWAAWMLDAAVPDGDRCTCRASRFRPHPCAPEHGHPDWKPACPLCHWSGLVWQGFESSPCPAGCPAVPHSWSERNAPGGSPS